MLEVPPPRAPVCGPASTASLTLGPQRGAEILKTIILAPGRGGPGKGAERGRWAFPSRSRGEPLWGCPHGRKITASNLGCSRPSAPTSSTDCWGGGLPPQACRHLRTHAESTLHGEGFQTPRYC